MADVKATLFAQSLFIRNLRQFRAASVHWQPVTVFFWPFIFTWQEYSEPASSRYYILVRLFIRDTFFQLSAVRASAVRTNRIEFPNSFDW